MFLFTVTKPRLRQAGALALCAVCLAGTITAAVHFANDSVTASAGVSEQTTIETTQDIATYFTGYGFEVDLATAAVDSTSLPEISLLDSPRDINSKTSVSRGLNAARPEREVDMSALATVGSITVPPPATIVRESKKDATSLMRSLSR